MDWLLERGAGLGVLFLAGVVFVVGAVITSQTLMGAVAGSVREYAALQALGVGFESVIRSQLLTNTTILRIQVEVLRNKAGFRRVAGTTLKDQNGRTVYNTPDQRTERAARQDHRRPRPRNDM